MENKEQQILSEIKAMMATIRQQMEMLDAKMAELQQMSRFEGEEVAPIVLDIDTFDLPVEEIPEEIPASEEPSDDLPFDLPVEEAPEEEPADECPVEEAVQEDPVAAEPVVEPALEAEIEPETEPVVEPEMEPEPALEAPIEPEIEPVVETAPELIEEDLPEEIVLDEPVAEEPAPVVLAEPAPEVTEPLELQTPVSETPVEEPTKPVVKEAIIDAMTEKQAWRTDMPGTQVKDVRLAISLHERVLFINHLFSEDPMAFQATVNKVNASASLDEVVNYVKETFPQWNLESDLVYRFMMAVRRKIR
jgi:hypothetical protein